MDGRLIETAGRQLRVVEGGDPRGFPVLVHMGTPTSGLLFGPHVPIAEACGIRLVSYDRPGYGESTPRPGRTVANSADDVAAVADALGIRRLGVWGFSGGPPFGLAAAARLPNLVIGAVALASPAPGIWGSSEDDYEASRRDLLALGVEDWRERVKPEHAVFAEFAVETLRIGLATSAEGWREDEVALAGDWGFELEEVQLPVRLRHGREDRAVPIENGELLAARLPNVEAEFDDSGHQDVLFRDPEPDFRWLASL